MFEKLKLTAGRVEKKSYTALPVLQWFLTLSEESLSSKVQDITVKHMVDLSSASRKYVPELDTNNDLMRYPFKQRDIASL